MCHIDNYVLKRSKGIDKPWTLRSGWCCCIRRHSSRWSFFWQTMLPNISGCLKLKRCVGLAKRSLQTSERYQICVRWFGLLNFSESVQCKSTHTCMLVCRLYLSDGNDPVWFCMWKNFSTYYFHLRNETDRHDGIAVYKSLHFSPHFIRNFPEVGEIRDDHYPVCRLDIRQDSEFATGYWYLKTAFKR